MNAQRRAPTFSPRISPTRNRAWHALLRLLVSRGVYHGTQAAPVVRPDGEHAPWVLDTLALSLTPQGSRLAGACLVDILRHFDAPQLAARGVTGVPLMHACLNAAPKRYTGLVVRKEPKPYGSRKLIEGPLVASEPVVVVDDSVVSGHSVISAVLALEEQGLVVEGVVCLVRFGWSEGMQWLQSRGYRSAAVFDLWEDVLPRMGGPIQQIRNPTMEMPEFRTAGRRLANGLHPATLARSVLTQFLRTGTAPPAPASIKPTADHRGGVFVSVRPRSDVTQRHAREGFWHFPDENAPSCPEDIRRAAIKTAVQLPPGEEGLALLADSHVAVTFLGRMRPCTVGEIDNNHAGIVVRSLERPGWMGGALPCMPGIDSDWQQFQHAHTTNAKLLPCEPFQVYRHDVTRLVEPDASWHSSGTPQKGGFWTHDPDVCGKVARRAHQVAVALIERQPVPVAGALDPQLLAGIPGAFVTVLHKGLAQGCMGGPMRNADLDLQALVASTLQDSRFEHSLHHGDQAVVTVSFLHNGYEYADASPRQMAGNFTPGVHALLAAQGDLSGLLLPVVAQRDDLDADGFLNALHDKAGIGAGTTTYRKFDCVTWLADAHQTVRLTGGLPPPSHRDGSVEALAHRWASYVERQRCDQGGLFLHYAPLRDTLALGSDPARTAHGAWVLGRAGRALRRPSLTALAGVLTGELRAMLVRRAGGMWLAPHDHAPCVSELAFLALALRHARGHARLQKQLAETLLTCIDRHGRVQTHAEVAFRTDDPYQEYAPGQVLLALAAHDEMRPLWLRSLRWYFQRWQQQRTWGPVSWLMQACAAVDLPETRSMLTELGEFALGWQSAAHGGFLTSQQDDTPGFTTALYLEGLAAGVASGRIGTQRAIRWRAAVNAGWRFLESITLHASQASVLPNPTWADGGVIHSVHRPFVRVDFVQHAMSAAIEWLRVPRHLRSGMAAGSRTTIKAAGDAPP